MAGVVEGVLEISADHNKFCLSNCDYSSCVIAIVSVALIPGFTLALGFLLGGIVSPPDAIAATTTLKQAKAPKVLVSLVEGESLLNDATSLIIFRFAMAAVLTGQFHLGEASLSFFFVVLMGVLIGLAVGLIFYCIHRFMPVTASIEIVLTIVTPYCMYYAAEHFHYSGVLAVVSGGLFLSGRRLSMLNYMSRIQGVNVWNSIVFVLNGLIFLLIGLQLPLIVSQLGETSLSTAIYFGLLISLVLIVARLLCTFAAAGFTRFMSRYIKVADANPGWKGPLVFGWSGIRGVVSLAAALSIPIISSDGVDFPYRNLILFITFIVIVVTLVLQGLTLPWLLKRLDFKDANSLPIESQEHIIQKKIAQFSSKYLEDKLAESQEANKHLFNLKTRLKIETDYFSNEQMSDNHRQKLIEFHETYLDLLQQQRKLINDINIHSEFDEVLIRKYQFLIDIEEYKIHQKFFEDLN
jgi:Na+/H+ antiporter